ncbi:hypothetical protein SFUMM280S_02900 [Streptomyces fumanus]
MTEISAGQTAVLLSQWRQYENGPLTDLDTTPTIQITAISDGASALPATTAGVTHPGTGSYGYAWTPAAGLTPGLYLALWTGLASGAPVTATETVTVLAAPMAEPTAADPRPVWYATREEIKAELDVRDGPLQRQGGPGPGRRLAGSRGPVPPAVLALAGRAPLRLARLAEPDTVATLGSTSTS